MASISLPSVGRGATSGNVSIRSIAVTSNEITNLHAAAELAEVEQNSYSENVVNLPKRATTPAPARTVEPLQVGPNETEYSEAELIARGTNDIKDRKNWRKEQSPEDQKGAELRERIAKKTMSGAKATLAETLGLSKEEVDTMLHQDNKTMQLQSAVDRVAHYTGIKDGVNALAYAALYADGAHSAPGIIETKKGDNLLNTFNPMTGVKRFASVNTSSDNSKGVFAALRKVGIQSQDAQDEIMLAAGKQGKAILSKQADDLIAYAIKNGGITMHGKPVTEATPEVKQFVLRAMAGYLADVTNTAVLSGVQKNLVKTIEGSKGNKDIIANALAERMFKRFSTNDGDFSYVLRNPVFQRHAKGYGFVNLEKHAAFQALYEKGSRQTTDGRATALQYMLTNSVKGVTGSTSLSLLSAANKVTDPTKKAAALRTLAALGLNRTLSNADLKLQSRLIEKVPNLAETFDAKDTKEALVQNRGGEVIRQAVQLAGEKGHIRALTETFPAIAAAAKTRAEIRLSEEIAKIEDSINKIEKAAGDDPTKKAEAASRTANDRALINGDPVIKDSFLTVVTSKSGAEIFRDEILKVKDEEVALENEVEREDI